MADISNFERMLAGLEQAKAAKDFDLAALASEVYPEPAPESDYTRLVEAGGKALPESIRRILRLGGTRMAAIVAEADTIVADELVRSGKAHVVAKLADAEIATPPTEGVTPEARAKMIREAAAKGIKRWTNEAQQAKAAFAAAYATLKAVSLKTMALEPEETAEVRGALAILSKFA